MINSEISIVHLATNPGPCRKISSTIFGLDTCFLHPSISLWDVPSPVGGTFMQQSVLEQLRDSYDLCPTTCPTLGGKDGAPVKLAGTQQTN